MTSTDSLRCDHIRRQIKSAQHKEFECSIIVPLLCDEGLKNIMPITQQHVKSWLIDLYYPQLNLAIEIDELHHKQNRDSDKSRESEITKVLGCEFIRIDVSEFDIYQAISHLKEKILSKRSSTPSFEDWEPKYFDMSDAKNDHPDAVFVKSNLYESGGDPLISGIMLGEIYRKSAKQVVALSACPYNNTSVIAGIYDVNEDSWIQVGQTNKYRIEQSALNCHSLLISGATNWTKSSDKDFGINLQTKSES